MKKLLLFLLISPIILLAQTPTKINIKGQVADTSNTILPFATVLILQPKDSSMVNFTRSDENGNFEFKNVRNQAYLIKATFVSYLPYQELTAISPNPVLDLGKIKLKLITKELYEVVIKTAKAPISIKGDTIEYDARKFKVPPGSSVEDLLKKLPGFQIDGEGNIKAQGENVSKVTVDGKQFFSGDAKLATKNLPAEAINKVQVFNDKTEQAKLTGIEDGKKEKTVNLELKEEFKKGGFGKVTAGVGTDERIMGKGNYNKFDEKNQLSVIGFGNNINQTGLSNDDYQDFKGSQSYNWNDNADFGFSSNGGMRFFYFNDSDENEELGVPQTWRPGGGFSKNFAGGLNYNYDTKKTKFSSSYFVNHSELLVNTLQKTEQFLENTSYLTNTNSNSLIKSTNHRMSFRFEKQLDSLNTLILISNGKIGARDVNFSSLSNYLTPSDQLFRNQNNSNTSDANTNVFANTLIFRHKFKKKGRNFAISSTYNLNSSNSNVLQFAALNEFTVPNWQFALNGLNLNQNQNIDNLVNRNQLKASLLYLEPLSKKWSLESFYNFSNTINKIDRDVFNSTQTTRIDTLSRYLDNNSMYNRIGTSLRYNNKGFNVSAGLAAQQFLISGKFYNDQNQPTLGTVDRHFETLIPNIGINYDLKNNRYLYGSYQVGTTEPQSRDLQPFKDISNPMFIRIGDPNLLPQVNHETSIGYSVFNPATFKNLFMNFSFSQYQNQIVYNQSISNQLITTIKPVNISGGNQISGYFSYGFPIVKTKFSMNIYSSTFAGKNLVYINDILNENQNNNYSFGTRYDITPLDWLSIFIEGSTTISRANYSINEDRNQKFYTNSIDVDATIQFPKLVFLTSKMDYNAYVNKGLDLNQRIPLLNMSLYKILGKSKKSEVRLSAYDIFKKNLGVRQTAFQNTISQSQTQTLTRYFMLTYTYNMRGVSSKMKKSRWE
jgi:hypothetical protein